jgi:ABC-type amino acid transport substrate-binding protein
VRNAIGCGNRRRRATAQESTAVKELIPTGKLRGGGVFAATPSAFFVVKDTNGEPHGVTVDLAVELGRELGVAVEFMVAPQLRAGNGRH